MNGTQGAQAAGFDGRTRVLLVNADDLGMNPAVNRGVLAAIDHGIVRSTSLMTTCPGTEEALEILRRRTDIPFGVHLTLVRDRPSDTWSPRAARREVSSLIDRHGRFPLRHERLDTLHQVRTEDVAVEFDAQLASVLSRGLHPTHLDFHSLADGGRPDVLAVAEDLARRHGLAVRIWLDPGLQRAREAGLPVVDHPFTDSFSLDTGGKAQRYEHLLRALPPGLTEWAVHPASEDVDEERGDPRGWAVRTTDLAFLTSPEAASIVRSEGVVLTDYRPLQRRWAGREGLPGQLPGTTGTAASPPTRSRRHARSGPDVATEPGAQPAAVLARGPRPDLQ